jgi:hypothetical protein
VILLPVDTLFVAARAIQDFLADLRSGDRVQPRDDRSMSFAAFGRLIGIDAQMALGEKYTS